MTESQVTMKEFEVWSDAPVTMLDDTGMKETQQKRRLGPREPGKAWLPQVPPDLTHPAKRPSARKKSEDEKQIFIAFISEAKAKQQD